MKYIVMVSAAPPPVSDPTSQWKGWDMWVSAIEAGSPEGAAEAMAKGQGWTGDRLVAVIPADQAQQFWVKPERAHKANKTGNIVKGLD